MSSAARIKKKEYTKFILKLVNEITNSIFEKLKYALRDDIPSATMEKLQTPLNLFKELEKREIVGPENLGRLRELLEMSQERDLVSMLDIFDGSCEVASSKAVAKPAIKNYLKMDGYYLQIKGGQHYNNECVGEYVEVPSGSGYALIIKNLNLNRCLYTIKIDGHVVCPGSIINPRQSVTIERPYQRNGKFKFFALDHSPPGSGVNKWRNENGLVEVTFTPERPDMKIDCYAGDGFWQKIPLSCSNQTTDVGLRKMISSAFHFDESTAISVHFGFKPVGQRNIKLTEYDITNKSRVEIKFGLTGGGIHVPPSLTQSSGISSNNDAPKWIPGATTLQGESEQTFAGSTQSDFVPDRDISTTLYLRLVARADDNPPSAGGDCTPLARRTLIPPPVANW